MKEKKSAVRMIIEVKSKSFIYKIFYTKGSARKTFHEGGKDKYYKFEDVGAFLREES